jgi:hypothetical protein
MNGRVVLLGLVVAVLGVGIYFLVRGGDDAEPARSASGGGDTPAREIPTGPVREGAPPERDPGEGKTIPADPEAAPMPVEHTREDGTTVRDHRKNPGEYIRPSLPHPEESPIAAEVTASVMQLIRPVVLECMKDVPEAAYGQRPVVMTRATISIDDQGTMTVDDIGPAFSDIDESAANAALECIRGKSGSLSAKVDHAAVASANLAFPIRPLDYRRDKPPSK